MCYHWQCATQPFPNNNPKHNLKEQSQLKEIAQMFPLLVK
jgi:hypothetical protein